MLDAIQHAFEIAYRDSLAGPVVSFDRRSVRYTLAKRILAAALEEGERDPIRLAGRALEAIEAYPVPSCMDRASQKD